MFRVVDVESSEPTISPPAVQADALNRVCFQVLDRLVNAHAPSSNQSHSAASPVFYIGNMDPAMRLGVHPHKARSLRDDLLACEHPVRQCSKIHVRHTVRFASTYHGPRNGVCPEPMRTYAWNGTPDLCRIRVRVRSKGRAFGFVILYIDVLLLRVLFRLTYFTMILV